MIEHVIPKRQLKMLSLNSEFRLLSLLMALFRVLATPFERVVIFHQEPHIPPYYQLLATGL
jgi:hypothetical protein